MIIDSSYVNKQIGNENFKGFLDLSNKNFIRIERDAFKPCKNREIKALRIQNDSLNLTLRKAHQSLFEPVKEHLKEMYLSNITFECSLSIFNHLQQLKKLSIQKCSFNDRTARSKMDEENFISLVSLESIILNNNSSYFYENNIFKRSENIKLVSIKLDQSKNTVINFNASFFEPFKKVTTLQLIGEKILLDEKCLECLPELNELQLQKVNMRKEQSVLPNFPKLQALTCKEVKNLNLNKIAELVSLEELTITPVQSHAEWQRNLFTESHSRSQVDDMYVHILATLINLTHLDLTHCYLTYIDNTMLSNLKNLVFLNLSDNKIYFIADDAFDSLVNLKEIHLENNCCLEKINFNRVFLKQDKLEKISVNPAVKALDLMDGRFNF